MSKFYFVSKSKLDVVYYLWDLLIKEQDQLFLHFFIVALLKLAKAEIVNSDFSQIPSILSQLNIKSKEEAWKIYLLAKELKEITPVSFRLLAKRLEIFNPGSTQLKELYQEYDPENMFAMPIMPSEIFHITYNNIVSCCDDYCKNFRRSKKIKQETCEFCKENKQSISYILLDLRIPRDQNENKHVLLPMTVVVDKEELKAEDVSK